MIEFLFTWIVTMGLSALAFLIWLAIHAHDYQNNVRKWLVRPLRSHVVAWLPIHLQPPGSDR